MKVLEDVHVIECPFSQYFTSVVALLGKEIILIDAGLDTSPEEAIIPYLRNVGREVNEISYVILTHGHADHAGGAPVIKRMSGAKIVIHSLDEPLVKRPTLQEELLYERFDDVFSPNPKAEFEAFTPDILVNDSQIINAGDRELEVIHIPGHTAGSICIKDSKSNIYISSDGIQGKGSRRPLLFHDSLQYVKSVKKMSKMNIEALIIGHPFPPFEQAVLFKEKAKEHINQSLEAIKELKEKVYKTIIKFKELTKLSKIQEAIPESRLQTVGCVLEEFYNQGLVKKIKDENKILWFVSKE